MVKFKAKVIEDIPKYRLLMLGGINSEGDPDEGWETVYLKVSRLGIIPDLVTTENLKEGSFVDVTIKDNPSWVVEASQRLPAGTLVMSDADGRVKSYTPSQGHYIGFTTHAVEEGEIVEIVRKYGITPQNQEEVD